MQIFIGNTALLEVELREQELETILTLPDEFALASRLDSLLLDCCQPIASTLWRGWLEEEEEEELMCLHGVPIGTFPRNSTNSTTITKQSAIKHTLLLVDLRTLSNMSLDTPSDVYCFLQSLLSSSNAASVWSCRDHADLVPVVAVILPQASYPTLECFPVSNAAPSYLLHSVARLPADKRTDATCTTEQHSLLVYNVMPPRLHLTRHHPLDATAVLPRPDCLWETYYTADGDQVIRPVAPPYYDALHEFPMLKPLLSHLSTIQHEAKSIPQWTAWPETNHYASGTTTAEWTVFPLCHCFPANQPSQKQWIAATCRQVPQTTQLLQTHLGNTLRTALFSRLSPTTSLGAHTGWADLANHVLRVHVSIHVPTGGGCGTWVDGVVQPHTPGSVLCFDDSKTHRAFHYASQEERVVLILDLARPTQLPDGTAVGGHSEELDAFIASME